MTNARQYVYVNGRLNETVTHRATPRETALIAIRAAKPRTIVEVLNKPKSLCARVVGAHCERSEKILKPNPQ